MCLCSSCDLRLGFQTLCTISFKLTHYLSYSSEIKLIHCFPWQKAPLFLLDTGNTCFMDSCFYKITSICLLPTFSSSKWCGRSKPALAPHSQWEWLSPPLSFLTVQNEDVGQFLSSHLSANMGRAAFKIHSELSVFSPPYTHFLRGIWDSGFLWFWNTLPWNMPILSTTLYHPLCPTAAHVLTRLVGCFTWAPKCHILLQSYSIFQLCSYSLPHPPCHT